MAKPGGRRAASSWACRMTPEEVEAVEALRAAMAQGGRPPSKADFLLSLVVPPLRRRAPGRGASRVRKALAALDAVQERKPATRGRPPSVGPGPSSRIVPLRQQA